MWDCSARAALNPGLIEVSPAPLISPLVTVMSTSVQLINVLPSNTCLSLPISVLLAQHIISQDLFGTRCSSDPIVSAPLSVFDLTNRWTVKRTLQARATTAK